MQASGISKTILFEHFGVLHPPVLMLLRAVFDPKTLLNEFNKFVKSHLSSFEQKFTKKPDVRRQSIISTVHRLHLLIAQSKKSSESP